MKHGSPIRAAARVASFGVLVGALLGVSCVSPAWACNTPVFRYAMYNWLPAPYYVFYFHYGEVPEGDDAANKLLEKLADADPPANVLVEVTDVSQGDQLQRLPGIVRDAWKVYADGTTPMHLVYSSWGLELYHGRLDESAVRAMVDSPARRQLAKTLQEGSAAVMLILTGPDENANKRAEKAAREVVAKAAAGEIWVSGGDDFDTPPGFLPQEPDDPPPEDDRQDKTAETLKLSVLKLSRRDLAETWLVDLLLTAEPDLKDPEFAGAPMVFTVFGRGRALPPFVGKGITTENLADCAEFLTGPCSCMVKDQNPGVDLLVRWNWDAAAEAMAAKDPAFTAGPWGYQELVAGDPDNQTESPPTEQAPAETLRETPGETPAASDPEASPTDPPTAQGRREANVGYSPIVQKANPEAEAESPVAQAPVEENTETRWGSDSFAARQAWKLGIGLAVGAAAVVIAGLVLVRRQRSA